MKLHRLSLIDIILDADTTLAEIIVAVSMIAWGVALEGNYWGYTVILGVLGAWILWLIGQRSLARRRIAWLGVTGVAIIRSIDVVDEQRTAWGVIWIVVIAGICILFVFRLWADMKLREDNKND